MGTKKKKSPEEGLSEKKYDGLATKLLFRGSYVNSK